MREGLSVNCDNNCYGDQRKTWKTINELTSRKSNKTVINEMEYNGVNSGDQTDIAEMLNSFFTEIGPRLSRDVTEVDKSFEEFLTETDKNFVFEKTTPTRVFALLSKLCKSKATGLDNLSAKLLRECPGVLAESLTHIFNQSLMTGIFPDEWKSARVTPLYKNSGKRSDPQIFTFGSMPVNPAVTWALRHVRLLSKNKRSDPTNFLLWRKWE